MINQELIRHFPAKKLDPNGETADKWEGKQDVADDQRSSQPLLMDKQYFAINGTLFFWLLGLIAWSVDAIALARLAAACALVAFLLHSQRNKINAMFIKKNKTEPQASEAATLPAINPEPEAVASKKHETTIIASGVHFVGNIVASGHVYIHGQLTGNIEAKEHLIKVMREGQVEGKHQLPGADY